MDEPAEPVEPARPVVYGNPAQNQDFFASRDWETAPLMTATMVYRQLTGSMISDQDFVDEATNSSSRYRSNRPVYLGPNRRDYVSLQDAQELLADRGIDLVTRSYPKAQEQRALANLQSALQDPRKAVVVTVSTPIEKWDKPYNHEVVVLGIDVTNGLVHLNDAWSPTVGRARTMTVTEFLAAWASNYATTTAQLSPSFVRRDQIAADAAIAA